VIRREGNVMILEGAVTLYTVSGLVGAAEEHFQQGARAVDFRHVTEVDSAAVALALEWLRQAASKDIALRLENLPAAMRNLATLYGVSELLVSAAA
jgi:phospholipid transport system transporter-binding protein